MRHRRGRWSWLALLLGTHCQAYDETLLNKEADKAEHSMSSAQTIPVSQSNTTRDQQPDGPLVPLPSPPAEIKTRCGDGIISGVEKCDTAIAEDEPGACPTQCPPLAACAPRVLNGTACQAECVLIETSCVDGDSCCPSSCNTDTDSDCSPACGDGMIDTKLGETCEPDVRPCEKSDADCTDSDPCTVDHLVGNPRNCNSQCTHTPITERSAGDQCCPTGADNSVDPDCAPVCGNGVRERGEDCDGEPDCASDCTSPSRASQMACLERFGTDECKRCSCTHCTELFLACQNSGVADRDALCSAVMECTQRTRCEDVACFCDQATPACVPTGPCSMEIADATGTFDPLLVGTLSRDPNSTLGRASSADACRLENCREVCQGAQ